MPSVWAPFNELHEIIALALVPAILGLVFLVGGKVERIVAGVMTLDAFVVTWIVMRFDRFNLALISDVKAVAILLLFAVLTWRLPHRWLVAMTALQAFAVLLRLSTWLDRSIINPVNGLLLNITGWLMLGLLAAMAVGHAVSRRRQRKEAGRTAG